MQPISYANPRAPAAGDERRVVGRRIDAAGGVIDDGHQDRAARLQHAKLLELLRLLERRRRHRGDLEQRLAAIGVDAEVLVKQRRIVERPGCYPDRARTESGCG